MDKYILLNRTSYVDSYKRVQAKSLNSCWSRCIKEKGKCQGATINLSNKTCYLFKSIKEKITPSDECISITRDNSSIVILMYFLINAF